MLSGQSKHILSNLSLKDIGTVTICISWENQPDQIVRIDADSGMPLLKTMYILLMIFSYVMNEIPMASSKSVLGVVCVVATVYVCDTNTIKVNAKTDGR